VIQKKEDVAVVLYPGCIYFEVALAIGILSRDFRIVLLSPEGGAFTSSEGPCFSQTLSYSNYDVSKCRALLVPGGDAASVMNNTALDALVQSCVLSKNVVLAAICGGPLILAKAGVLVGRRISHGFETEQLEFLEKYFRGVELTAEAFVGDGPFLTAQAPFYVDFAVEVAERLGVVSKSRMIAMKNYYRGFPEGRLRPIALAVLRDPQGRLLVVEGRDEAKAETFYRPPGGGIEFGETAVQAATREIQEELGFEVVDAQLLGFCENIFAYEGRAGHEIIALVAARFQDTSLYARESFVVNEAGRLAHAVWKSPDEIRAAGHKLYPVALEGFETLVKECRA
jgi:putative intracellular protease/amidase/8-oxo-dGTP pyrophosphatase MutT (NUDIX family)